MAAAEKVSARLKANALAGSTVTLKLKTADFRIRTRAQSLDHPTQLAARIFAAGRELLARETDGTKISPDRHRPLRLCEADGADLADLLDRRTAEAERRSIACATNSATKPWSRALRSRATRTNEVAADELARPV